MTTNEDRELPAAFLRRCLVLQIEFPRHEADQLNFLLQRGRVQVAEDLVPNEVALEAANQVIQDRARIPRGQPRPGAAEYIDLLRVLAEWHPGDRVQQEQRLAEIRDFVLKKHLDESAS